MPLNYSNKFIRGSFLLILVVVFLFPASHFAFAVTVTDLQSEINNKQSEIESIEREIQKFQETLNETSKEAKTLTTQIKTVDNQIGKITADIRLTNTRIEKTQLSIEELAIEIRKAGDKISVRQDELGELLRAMNEIESDSIVEVLLGNEQLSDFFTEVRYLSDLDVAIRLNLSELYEFKDELSGERTKEESEQRKLANLRSDYSARKNIQQTVKEEKNSLLKRTKAEESAYQKLIADREKLRQEILQEIASIEDELLLLIDPTTLPRKREGVLAYPLESIRVTQGFGLTEFARNRTDVYAGGGHNGIDFAASIGTSVLAADGGTVREVGNSDLSCPGGSYGKWVLVDHGNNLSTLYAHLSLISVSKGQEVNRNDRIAYSGNTGYSTGPHVHFTVYDTRTLRFGPSRSGRCTFLPYGGYLDPQDYL